MAKVKLNDVAIEARETWKQSKTDVPVVGLEHLEPDEIWLKRWDLNPDENTFTKGFKKGQLLFGRRRAYQKKMSVASCDGICSGDITVISAKPEKILPDLLPFYLRTDAFFDFAVRGSGGSLSPRVKWSHISDYEFDLPPIEEQKKLAELLWAANDLKEKYKKAITATDEMLKAKFREMFGCVGNGEWGMENGENFNAETQRRREGESGLAAKNAEVAKSKWPVVKLVSVCHRSGEYGVAASADAYDPKKGRYIRITDITDEGKLNNDIVSPNIYEEKCRLKINDILFARTGNTVGKTYIHKNGFCTFAGYLIRYVCKEDIIDPNYLFSYTHTHEYYKWVENAKKIGAQPNINATQYDEMPIPLPPLALQREFVAIAEKAEAAKTALKKSIADIDQVMKGLINQ